MAKKVVIKDKEGNKKIKIAKVKRAPKKKIPKSETNEETKNHTISIEIPKTPPKSETHKNLKYLGTKW